MKNFNLLNMVSQNNQVKYIPIELLVPYHNHQFKLYSGERFNDMVESIRQNGVLNPILVQPINGGVRYEILSGHNRVECAKAVGVNTIPAVIKENLSEEDAEMYVIETNLIQRGFNELAISEQAKILGYRYSKMFSQGKRNDIINEINKLEGKELTCDPMEHKLKDGEVLDKELTCDPVEHKLKDGEVLDEELTCDPMEHKLKDGEVLDEELTCDPMEHKLKSRDILAKEYSLSPTTIARLLKVNKLIEPFKNMVDDKTMPIRVGFELSFIPEDGQNMVYEVISTYNKKLNIKLSKALRNLFNTENVTTEMLKSLIISEKATAVKSVKVTLNEDVYTKYFDKNASSNEVSEILQKALEMYFSKD